MTTQAQVEYIRPRVNILEDEDAVTIEAELPGVTLDGTEIEVRDGLLVLQGRRTNGHKPAAFRLRERPHADFYRAFRLGDGIDTERISARMTNGVLTVSVPKAEHTKPRTISVN